ncbi:hypothetical protein VPH35_063582 [Triticum aestivum]
MENDPKPCSAVKGTQVMNMVARRKTLQNSNDDYPKIVDFISRFTVHHINVNFSCRKHRANRADVHSGSMSSRLDAIRNVYGASVVRDLMMILGEIVKTRFRVKSHLVLILWHVYGQWRKISKGSCEPNGQNRSTRSIWKVAHLLARNIVRSRRNPKDAGDLSSRHELLTEIDSNLYPGLGVLPHLKGLEPAYVSVFAVLVPNLASERHRHSSPQPPSISHPMASAVRTPRQLAPIVGRDATPVGVTFRTRPFTPTGERIAHDLVSRLGAFDGAGDDVVRFVDAASPASGSIIPFGELRVYVALVPDEYPSRVLTFVDPPLPGGYGVSGDVTDLCTRVEGGSTIGLACFGPHIREEPFPKGFTLARDTLKYNGFTKPEDWLTDYTTDVGIAGGKKRVAVRYTPLMLLGSVRAWLNSLPANSINAWLDFEEGLGTTIGARKMEPALVDEKLIPWELNKFKLNPSRNGDVIAHYQINKPSDLTATAQLSPMARPLVCLHLKESENLPKISIMNLRHRYILRVEAVQELQLPVLKQKNIAVVVEPHDGPLTCFLVRLVLTERRSNAVPSQSLRDVIRQIVEAIEELRINGVYHGNLTIHNIYHSRVGGAIVVKLVNFQNRDIELEAAQLMDWVGLGNILHTISTAAKFRDNTASCSIIDHLASKLMALTSTNCLPSIKKDTLDDMFFWDTRRRTMFYIHEIPKALNDNDFVTRVKNHAWPLPWDSKHFGLVKAMNDYREEVAVRDKHKGVNPGPEVLKQYHCNGQDPIHNVQCMSGAYTHQDKIEKDIKDDKDKRMSVDVAVQKEQPELCLALRRGSLLEEGNEECFRLCGVKARSVMLMLFVAFCKEYRQVAPPVSLSRGAFLDGEMAGK